MSKDEMARVFVALGFTPKDAERSATAYARANCSHLNEPTVDVDMIGAKSCAIVSCKDCGHIMDMSVFTPKPRMNPFDFGIAVLRKVVYSWTESYGEILSQFEHD